MKILNGGFCIILSALLLTMAACSRPMIIRELESKAELVVDSQPEDASVYVDGQMVGMTPCTAMIDAGVHGRRAVMVAVSKEGYRTKQANVSLIAGKQMKWTNIHLEKMTTLEVDSDPEGASVYIDGRFVGETPCIVEVDAEVWGTRKVIVAVLKEGYETKRAEVPLAAGKQAKWTNIRLDKLTTQLPAGPQPVPTTYTLPSEGRKYEQATGAPIFNPANGHYYEVVTKGINWHNAKTAAESRTFRGLRGHLATITSQNENDLIAGSLPPGASYWIGGFQPPGSPEPDGNWQWITGESLDYTNWNAEAPNETGYGGENEDRLEFDGEWNDLRGSHILPGYVVEYEPSTMVINIRRGGDAANVRVRNVKDNKKGRYMVTELKEGAPFFHDEAYTMTHIPEEYLGLTQIQTSPDCSGGQDYRLTFEIDRPAYVYMAWDSRFRRPEERGQDPAFWFADNYMYTGKMFSLDAPHPKTDYWIYRSNNPYPKGKVELMGIDKTIGDTTIMWTIFLEEY